MKVYPSELDRAIADLRTEYRKAQNTECVQTPLAYALYQVWKKYDSKGTDMRKGQE